MSLHRRSVVVAFAGLMLLGGGLPALAGQAPSSAEARVVELINAERTARGLVRLYWDDRLADVAQARTDDMAAKDYFAHLPSGQLDALAEAEGIVHYRLAEIIQWNMATTPEASADAAVRWWMGSSVHRGIITNADYNYLAAGLTSDTNGHQIWAVLFLKGPDRTGARGWMTGATLGDASGGERSVTVTFRGRDVRLSVLTAGLRGVTVQLRPEGGTWVLLVRNTTERSRSVSLPVGTVHEFRARGRDWKGNVGAWSAVLRVEP